MKNNPIFRTITKKQMFLRKLNDFMNVAYFFHTVVFIFATACLFAAFDYTCEFDASLTIATRVGGVVFFLMDAVVMGIVIADFKRFWFSGWEICK